MKTDILNVKVTLDAIPLPLVFEALGEAEGAQ